MLKSICKIALILSVFLSHTSAEELTESCLNCLCHTVTGCDLKRKCDTATCGPFKISWGYWADAGKHTLEDQDPDAQSAFSDCAVDEVCVVDTVQGYMDKFAQDCNDDGVIDCDDYVLIHVFGGYGCKGQLPAKYLNKYMECKPK